MMFWGKRIHDAFVTGNCIHSYQLTDVSYSAVFYDVALELIGIYIAPQSWLGLNSITSGMGGSSASAQSLFTYSSKLNLLPSLDLVLPQSMVLAPVPKCLNTQWKRVSPDAGLHIINYMVLAGLWFSFSAATFQRVRFKFFFFF